jgi:electron transfer flavoprotein alpha subunit
MRALVFVEHHGDEPSKPSLGVLSRAAALFGDVSAAVCGSGVRPIAERLGPYGASTVFVADDAALGSALPQPRVDVLAQIVEANGIDTILFGSSVLAADIAAGLAARLDGGLNWDLTELALDGDRLTGTRPALQDSVLVEVGWTRTPRVGLVRAGTFEPQASGGVAPLVDVAVTVQDFSRLATLRDQEQAEAEGPSIEDAEIIVAGGRGLGSPDGFAVVEDLAKALGGAVGATRAVVDAGWYPYAAQVGQTGKNVSPKLYIACGISGAIQHKVGMQNASTIVAINKDRNAPIFDFCDLGLVGDLHEIVPKLTQLVRQLTGR